MRHLFWAVLSIEFEWVGSSSNKALSRHVETMMHHIQIIYVSECLYINCNGYAVVECPSLHFEMFCVTLVCANGLDGFDSATYLNMKE